MNPPYGPASFLRPIAQEAGIDTVLAESLPEELVIANALRLLKAGKSERGAVAREALA